MKWNFITDINKIKYEVCVEVAKATYAGTLAQDRDKIPYTLIPGKAPTYRCCVYREREIIRQRVRLAEGHSAEIGHEDRNIVQVIPAACEGCPINRFSVTNNCQMCMAKKCMGACNFGAITFERGRAHIDPKKCKECGRCAQACPYNAIADLMRPCKRSCPVDAITLDDDMIVVIDDKKCISCGQCIVNCPFGAISDKSFMVDVIKLIQGGAKVYAMVAPAIEGQFGPDVSIGMLRNALKDMGFEDMVEVSLGADFVSKYEAEELAEHLKEGKKMTTSCCPAFVNMIRKHFPQVLQNMSTTVSPMQATAHLIKTADPNAVCVFIGPCIGKKSEVIDTIALNGADYAMTYVELAAIMEARNVDPSNYEEDLQQGSKYGKNYSVSGGVTKAVLQTFKEKGEEIDVKVNYCNGAAECKKALMLLKVGRLPEDFIEGMACEGGCVNGPSMLNKDKNYMKDRNAQISRADDRGILENIRQYEDLNLNMHRTI